MKTDALQPELSLVVLCYQAGNYVHTLIAEAELILSNAGIDYELVLVANYDKETDPTPAIVKSISCKNSKIVPVIYLKKGRMGWDMRTGLQACNGKFIAVIDGDGQMPVSDVVDVYNVIRHGNFDLVKTYRVSRQDGFFRKWISKIYNTLFGYLFSPLQTIRDVNSKPKIFTRKALGQLHLTTNDWFTDAEMMIQAVELNFRIKEIPTVFLKNTERGSFVKWSTVFEFIWNMVAYKLYRQRNH